MTTPSILDNLSNDMADLVASAAASIVQVQGGRRPGSGLVYADGVVLTTVRALGREEDGLHIRRPDGHRLDAELAGWDPTTNLAVLRIPALDLPVVTVSNATPRPGHLAIAVARSWSNVVTASAGIVAVIGGPLPTGPRRAIDQVIRTTAPMHDGFSGGGFFDTQGGLIGVATAARIRGLGVVIPAGIAWKTAAAVIEHGRPRRGYIGLAAQRVQLGAEQRPAPDREAALLVVAVTGGSPAARAGVLVGDMITDFDGHPVDSPEDLLDLLLGDRVGRTVPLRLLRGGRPIDAAIEVGERPSS
jgi:S1-C subfamily serine protease